MRDYLEKLMQANDLTMDEIGHVTNLCLTEDSFIAKRANNSFFSHLILPSFPLIY